MVYIKAKPKPVIILEFHNEGQLLAATSFVPTLYPVVSPGSSPGFVKYIIVI